MTQKKRQNAKCKTTEELIWGIRRSIDEVYCNLHEIEDVSYEEYDQEDKDKVAELSTVLEEAAAISEELTTRFL